MWSPLLQEGLGLLDGSSPVLRLAGQELAHHVVHAGDRAVLWCDGDHGFNPYHLAELNLCRGHQADHGAEQVLVKRCMTPFQWDTVLTDHLQDKLGEVDAGLVLALPYDRLFSTDELQPWEQKDYIRYSLDHLRGLARKHHVPILLGLDVARWRVRHPELARLLAGAFDHGWRLGEDGAVQRLGDDAGSRAGAPGLGCQTRLTDFLDEEDADEVGPFPPGSFVPLLAEHG